MKSVSGVFTDLMLVCVLLIAFILPVIVSFNLIPKLYVADVKTPTPNQDVLGVVEDATLPPYEFFTQIDDTANTSLIVNNEIKGATLLDMSIKPEVIVALDSTVFLGNLVNNFGEGKYRISILRTDDTSDNLNLNLKLNNVKFNEDTILVNLNKNQKTSLSLTYSSDTPLNYNQTFKIVIERVED